MRKIYALLIPCLIFILQSCCLTIKEEKLGQNFILSEYDNADRIIIYSTENCSGSGIEIVPRTVFEYGYDDHWIIAKSSPIDAQSGYQYWIIDKSLQTSESVLNPVIQTHLSGPFDVNTFKQKLNTYKINLALKKID